MRSVVKLPADVASLTPAMASILMHPAIDESRWLAYIHQLDRTRVNHLGQKSGSQLLGCGNVRNRRSNLL
ncbi:hypothetical protein [Legionella pneumophila]|uniref:hypothetical protein n=1 Tax=Legionella pneumophila TaxID=446 RepID=UPI0012B68F2D|nr:hypothetical protein [Legionella pneumophila]HAT8979726.1 hypothetical protein [Legionella pneumophila subsp. pneumophila]HAT8988962.1 hypothetical protein [Legionella pneumophila subsp. pneumophila]HAT8991720.1 hypothetical protein [Legionella pneumophila subsp. pneumophila]HAT8994355.1 hypothetical protein [Legionella pneumophila subsp. pneumophila]HAT9377843.1 hypothetical protein [Legionella pneumophila subsp. pneumophila]